MIGFLGPAGTFTESATVTAFPELAKERLKPMPSVPAVLEAVAREELEAGVVPVENSIQGTVHVTIDALLTHPGLQIVQEVLLRIEQRLMVAEGVDLADVTEVWSHPQALAQCRGFITERGLKEVQYSSTAAAAAALAEERSPHVAVIGPEQAATDRGLRVLDLAIADNPENRTRFAVIRQVSTGVVCDKASTTAKYGPNKTMMVVTPDKNFPGVLASILNVFSTLGLNLCWIESRPTKQQMGTYQFFLEIQTGIEDEGLRRSIAVLKAYGHQVRVLGSYASAFLVTN